MAGGRAETPAPRSEISSSGFAELKSKCDMRWDESPSSFSRFAERILVSFCREPSAPDYAGGTVKATVDNSLDFLSRTVPDFHSRFVGKKVLDFGCGWGNQAVA